MANRKTEEVEEAPVKDKYNLGAADLEKVNVYDDDGDDAGMGMAKANLGKLADAPPQQKVVVVKPEDVRMMMEELELPKVRVEAALIEHDGHVLAALKSLMRL